MEESVYCKIALERIDNYSLFDKILGSFLYLFGCKSIYLSAFMLVVGFIVVFKIYSFKPSGENGKIIRRVLLFLIIFFFAIGILMKLISSSGVQTMFSLADLVLIKHNSLLSFIPFYVIILMFVAIGIFVLYILTKAFLGRQPKLIGDFWEHQKLAKSKVLWLNVLFIIMLIFIFLTAFSLFMLIFLGFEPRFYSDITQYGNMYDRLLDRPLFVAFNPQNYSVYFIISLVLSLGLICVIFIAYLIKGFLMSKNSIDKLAKSLNATEINSSHDNDKREKVLLNIIEEMAIASNMPMPRVFIMKDEKGVNAMCSGEYFGKANERVAIFVTQGAMDTFSRDELQGVIGHEFSHAFHGDVALNLKIFSLIFGLSCVMIAGEIILRGISKSKSSSSKDSGKGVAVIGAIALVFFALGFIGSLFAQIIQAAISRQKEYLADASSVQYTRNPQGIKRALEKLLKLQDNPKKLLESNLKNISQITNPRAKPCAHMFFLSGFRQIFATHPPLQKRIERLGRI